MKLENSNFTIYEVEDVKTIFETVILENDKIIIDLENVSKIDMSAVQLLISLKQTCYKHNKSFQLVNVSDEIIQSLNISGTAYVLGI